MSDVPPPQRPATRSFSVCRTYSSAIPPKQEDGTYEPDYSLKRCNADHFPPPPSKLKPAPLCIKKRENSVMTKPKQGTIESSDDIITPPKKMLTLAPIPEPVAHRSIDADEEEDYMLESDVIYEHLHSAIKDHMRRALQEAARDVHMKSCLFFMLWFKHMKYDPECLRGCTEHADAIAFDFWAENGSFIHDTVENSIRDILTRIESFFGFIPND